MGMRWLAPSVLIDGEFFKKYEIVTCFSRPSFAGRGGYAFAAPSRLELGRELRLCARLGPLTFRRHSRPLLPGSVEAR